MGKLPSGYHQLETLMAPLALGDDLEITLAGSPGVELTCSDPTLPTGPENLVWKALDLFARESATSLAYRVDVLKRIPHGAGLGGGSSNAAAALLAANSLHGNPLEHARLLELAAGIGSDVAFFLAGGWAVCRGRGEIVEPIAPPVPEELPILLVKPPFPVSTPWAYKNWAGSRELPTGGYEPQQCAGMELVNDLERPVFQKYLVLAELKRWLRELPGVTGALMSGSGSTVFAMMDPTGGMQLGQNAAAAVTQTFGDTFWVCLTRSTVTSIAL